MARLHYTDINQAPRMDSIASGHFDPTMRGPTMGGPTEGDPTVRRPAEQASAAARLARERLNSIVVHMAFCLALTGLVAVASPASALEFECNAPNDERFIHVDLPGTDHLCEVTVDYPSGNRRVLWYADHDTLFCSAKAYELRDKYENTWNFDCTTWPDRDGIDQLSARHRYILDAQLKTLMLRLAANAASPESDTDGDEDTAGDDAGDPLSDDALLADGEDAPSEDVSPETQDPERVLSVKSTTSASSDDQSDTLVLQFFIGNDGDGVTRDITQVIIDEGRAWRITSRIDNLASHIKSSDARPLVSAIVTGVTDDGLLEVSTATASVPAAPHRPQCEGRQYLQIQRNGPPQATTEHELICDPA